MIIGLLNLEPKYRNLALEKVRLYYQNKGDFVEDYFALNKYDKVYASSIFTFTKKHILPEGAICGGSGFDLTTNLPTEINEVKPHLNFGFTTRGCIRNCPFCIVPQKEGKIHIEGDLLDLWDGKTKLVVVMDNNILALPEHFAMICQQARENNIMVDFNQGLDHRLLTPEIVRLMTTISHTEYRFAFDRPEYLPSVKKAISILRDSGINQANWYVLVGYDTTPKEDLFRLIFLRDMRQRVYVQRFETCYHDSFYVALAKWASPHDIFAKKTWRQFIDSYCTDRRGLKQQIETQIKETI